MYQHLSTPRRALRLSLLASAIVVLGACASSSFMLDRNAKAPRLDGFGKIEMKSGSSVPAADELFAQGMAQAYGFNEAEAVRAFKAALALDPACAMCAWGVAWQLGPNINNSQRGDLREALFYVDYALKHSSPSTPHDRALIESLALRYAHGSEAKNIAPIQAEICGTGSKGGQGGEKAHPLDVAYAERMRDLAARFPDDPDLMSFYAEAEMIATRDDWWDRQTGKPGGRMGEVADKLEAALVKHPKHTGLNHYMIHSVDALQVASRAEAAADRLGALAPKSPHLLHMPAHTYVQIGRYADATRVNQQALAADETMMANLKAQGFSVSKDWRGHNGHFQWYGALMEGRSELALGTARKAAELAKGDHEYAEYLRSMPSLTLLRLQRWDELIKEPMPTGGRGMASVLGEMAHGIALARSGRSNEAKAALARLDASAEALTKKHTGSDYIPKMIRSIAGTARAQLRAELALADKRPDEALARQAEAVKAAFDADGTEPPMLAAGTRLSLGQMQLKLQRFAEAEQSFRADLVEHPKSGWALQGLMQALKAQGKPVDGVQAELQKSWALADAALKTNR